MSSIFLPVYGRPRAGPSSRIAQRHRCSASPAKTELHGTVVGGEEPSRGMPGEAMPSEVKAIGRRTSYEGRYARWKGSPGTMKSWLTPTAEVGRTP